jgi:hypothetical protein
MFDIYPNLRCTLFKYKIFVFHKCIRNKKEKGCISFLLFSLLLSSFFVVNIYFYFLFAVSVGIIWEQSTGWKYRHFDLSTELIGVYMASSFRTSLPLIRTAPVDVLPISSLLILFHPT